MDSPVRMTIKHRRTAGHVVRQLANATATIVPQVTTTASLRPQQAGKQLVSALNKTYAMHINIAFLLGVGAMLLVAAPAIATWVAAGRLKSGWLLSREKTVRPEPQFGLEKVSSSGSSVRPPRVEAASVALATTRWLYNRCLLPTVPYVGLTIGQCVVGSGYLALVLTFLFLDAGRLDVNIKRPAYIAIAQIPAVFCLATKNSLVSIVGKGYEKLNFLHRLGGNLLITCALLHAGLFLRMTPSPDWSNPKIYTGATAAAALIIVAVTSFPLVRHTFYQAFVVSHILGYLTFLVAVNIHSMSARPFTYIAAGVYGFDLLCRFLRTKRTSATIVPLSAGMTMLQCHTLCNGWRPGQHVWLRVWKGTRALEAHPFTIANAPASRSPLPGQHLLTLLVKSTGDWTRSLNEFAARDSAVTSEKEDRVAFGMGQTVTVSIEGPFGGSMYNDFGEHQSILLVAGGSGITFAASCFEELIYLAVNGKTRVSSVTLVWAIKDISCVDWYQEMFSCLLGIAKRQTHLAIDLRIHVTGPNRIAKRCPVPGATLIPSRPDVSAVLSGIVNDISLSLGMRTTKARGGGIGVGVCGPGPLVVQTRRAAGAVPYNLALQVGGIAVHSEVFGW